MTPSCADRSCRVELSGAPRYELLDLHVAGGFYVGSAGHYGHQARYQARLVGDGAHVDVTLG